MSEFEDKKEETEPLKANAVTRSVLEWVETLVLAIVFVAVIFTFAARVITVDGDSMQPTYQNGDRVLVTGLLGEPEQGDVVIVVNVLDNPIIKRVIATEGQIVDFDESIGEITVDGEPINGEVFGIENGITYLPSDIYDTLDFPQTVPEGCIFVLGDNRGNSNDSRFSDVGMIDARNVLGKVVLNLYPFAKFGIPYNGLTSQ